MNEREIKEFIEQVKGRKIWFTGWVRWGYFIPDGRWEYTLTGTIFYGVFNSRVSRDVEKSFGIFGGLLPPGSMGARWEFMGEEGGEEGQETPKCTTSRRDIGLYGCSCPVCKQELEDERNRNKGGY